MAILCMFLIFLKNLPFCKNTACLAAVREKITSGTDELANSTFQFLRVSLGAEIWATPKNLHGKYAEERGLIPVTGYTLISPTKIKGIYMCII